MAEITKTQIARKKPGRPKNDELAARRRSEILMEATREFAAQGYRLTDVQVIADRLEIGKGTIYRYFPSKEELFLAAVDYAIRRLKADVESAFEQVADPIEQMRVTIRAYLAFFDKNGDVLELIIQERAEFKDRKRSTYFMYQESGLDRWRAHVKQLISDGRIRKMPVDRVLDVISELMYGTIFTNRLSGRRKRLDVQAEEILDVVLFGILTPKERKRLRPDLA